MKFAFLSSFAHLALDPAATRASGGAELQVALLARELARRKHEVTIIAADDGHLCECEFDGVRIRNGGRFHTGGAWDTLRAYSRVRQIIAELMPDYLCIMGWTAWLTLIRPARRRSRVIYICGSDAEVDGAYRRENRLRGALFERGVRLADQRFAMSEHQAGLLQKAGLSCALYRNLILPRTSPPDGKKDIDFLWVSRCVPLKRPHLFLDLADALPHARFTMIAPPDDATLGKSVHERASKSLNVELIQHVPYREIQRYFDRAHVFVNTSEFEGFPNTFIQSGQGGAALLSFVVDPDELLSIHEAGLCAAGDWETFVGDARQLHSDPDSRSRHQLRCASIVAQWHDNDQNVSAFLDGLPPPHQY